VTPGRAPLLATMAFFGWIALVVAPEVWLAIAGQPFILILVFLAGLVIGLLVGVVAAHLFWPI
jgi:hypothetical protein